MAVKRYDWDRYDGMYLDERGDWVDFDDYAALAARLAEVDRLQKDLKAEERGQDNLRRVIEVMSQQLADGHDKIERLRDWQRRAVEAFCWSDTDWRRYSFRLAYYRKVRGLIEEAGRE